MSTTAPTEFAILPLSCIQESPLNPRKHFNQVKLEELAESIRRQGVITPMIVRLASVLADIKRGKQIQGYELAAGHRRLRAARLAGVDTAPCIIRDLDDDAFLELLIIENAQREDVHPLEEAEGYAELLKRPGYDTATIAEKIGKAEAYIHGRIELLKLAEPARQAFLDNRITIGHARVIARLEASQQERALRECWDWQQNLVPLRNFKRAVRSNTGRNLAKAPFDVAAILERPDGMPIGACVSCSKAVGVNPLLIDEDGEQTCLDGACYDRKVESHVAAKTKAGLIAISDNYTPKDVPPGVLCEQEYAEIFTNVDEQDAETIAELEADLRRDDLDPDDREETEQQLKDLREQAAEQQQGCPHAEKAIVVHGHNDLGSEKLICRNPKCPVHGQQLRTAPKRNEKDVAREKAEQEKRLLKDRIAKKTRLRMVFNILRIRTVWKAPARQLRVVAKALLSYSVPEDIIDALSREVIPAWRGRAVANGSAAAQMIQSAIDAPDGSPISDCLAQIILALTIKDACKDYCGESELQRLKDLGASAGVEWKKVEAAVTKEETDALAKKKAKAAAKKPATKKAAKPDRKRAAAGDQEDSDE